MNMFPKEGKAMLNLKLTALSSLIFLAGCASNPDMAMKIESSTSKETYLIGTFDGSLALLHGDPKTANISASNGSLTCDGSSSAGQFTTDLTQNKVRHVFDITCSDGRKGSVVMTVNAYARGYGLAATGMGTGKLSDGSTIKIAVGDASASIGW